MSPRPAARTDATGSSSTCGRTATARWRSSTAPPKAGFDTLLVTVDVPVAGARLRDKRNGFSIPPALTLGTVLDTLPRPAWWINFLTTEPLAFASISKWSGTVAELLDTMFDPTVTYEDLAWIKEQWPGKLVVKGVQTVADAKRLAELGVDGITLSNHGGRQLDRAPIPFHLLPEVVREVGKDTEIHLDTGIMSGADIVASVALGARFTMVGRAYLYGLMAGGREGVDRTIEILGEQVARTMRLLGVASLEELEPGHVTQLQRLAPRGQVAEDHSSNHFAARWSATMRRMVPDLARSTMLSVRMIGPLRRTPLTSMPSVTPVATKKVLSPRTRSSAS